MLTVNLGLDGLDAALLNRHLAETGRAARAVVANAGVAVSRIDTIFDLDMHYVGQTHTVQVRLPARLDGGAKPADEAAVRAAFEAAYLNQFSRLLPGVPVRIVTLRTAAIGRRPHFDLKALAPISGGEDARRGTRRAWFDDEWRETAIFSRLDLAVGERVEGPAVLEQPDATTIVDPGLVAEVDAYGNLVVTRSAR